MKLQTMIVMLQIFLSFICLKVVSDHFFSQTSLLSIQKVVTTTLCQRNFETLINLYGIQFLNISILGDLSVSRIQFYKPFNLLSPKTLSITTLEGLLVLN